jgi:uncharacterized DUF497 family protein
MQCVTDQTASRWLDEWEGIFDWDPGNLRKLSLHQTNQKELESIFDGSYGYFGRIMDPSRNGWGEDRYLITGRSCYDKDFILICVIRGDKLRIVNYRQQQEKDKAMLRNLIKDYHGKNDGAQ